MEVPVACSPWIVLPMVLLPVFSLVLLRVPVSPVDAGSEHRRQDNDGDNESDEARK